MGLKVAMVTPWGKTIRCGIRTYSEHLIDALVKLDVEVYVVRWPRFGMRTPELIQSCVVEKIPVDKVDVIHTQNEYGLFHLNLESMYYTALKRLGKPSLSTMHAVGNFQVDAIVASASDRVIVHNEFCFRHFGHPENTVIIAHGCQPTECPPKEECKKALGIDPRIPIVGYQGFISPPKGVDRLIEAMHSVPNAALLIGGGWFTGEDTTYINNLKQTSLNLLPGRCQWLGYVPDERLSTVYGACQVIAYPSRMMTESGALLMALSHGKAVVCSDLPPAREKAKLGALTTFKSVRDLRRKIKRLLKDDEFRHRLEEGARKYSYQNRWEVIAEKHIKLYEEVIKRYGEKRKP